ncbi:carbohydrate ABC transporter permease [Streptomyces cocklensis]|jgi:multiple sugar transport system permease protein|nr:carbohydrate ABC transporter permease [Actinacidiphila cocklensis]MDD1062143.1 carbohydrate ABC transporter permease [Actinacidiphila cocklensis]WSX81699.1 carbohydrate ABC transporter permease [Streptomyces sp. NBC_00899]
MVVLAIPFVFPTWWMITSSLLPENEVLSYPPKLLPLHPQWSNYKTAFANYPLAHQYLNSLYIALLVTAGTMLVASLSGYAFARIPFPGNKVLFPLILSGLLIPTEVTVIPLFKMVDRLGLTNTHWPLIVIPILGAPSVLGTFVMRQFFLAIPDELEDAGRMDGLGRFGLYFRVALPLARPALASVAIFTFLNSWNMYLEPLVYETDKRNYTLPVALTQYTDAYGSHLWNIQLAASVTTVVPVLVVFIAAQRHFVEGLAQTGLKG